MNDDDISDWLSSPPDDRLQIGSVVESETVANNTDGLIVDVAPERADEYAVAVSGEGPNAVTTLADRYADKDVDPGEIVYQVLFSGALSSFPGWRSDSRPVIGAYHSGSFRSVAKAIPESLLTLVDDRDQTQEADGDE